MLVVVTFRSQRQESSCDSQNDKNLRWVQFSHHLRQWLSLRNQRRYSTWERHLLQELGTCTALCCAQITEKDAQRYEMMKYCVVIECTPEAKGTYHARYPREYPLGWGVCFSDSLEWGNAIQLNYLMQVMSAWLSS